MKRSHISLKTKLASALLTLKVADENGNLVPLVDHDDAKKMTEDQILSLVHWDHYPIAKALDGPDEHWNLRPTPIKEHRAKTSEKDIPMIAKSDRLAKAIDEFRRNILAKSTGKAVAITKVKHHWPKRKMVSRNNLKRVP